MRKIPTLFQRDPSERGRVLAEVTPGCEWVLANEGIPTRKYDGTCLLLADDEEGWYARRAVRAGGRAPEGFVGVDVDGTTGKVFGWEPVDRSPFFKFFLEALDTWYEEQQDGRWAPFGTYELIGPKINGNPERVDKPRLIPHAEALVLQFLLPSDPLAAYGILEGLLRTVYRDYEGIVWHHPDGRMAKLKRRDFA